MLPLPACVGLRYGPAAGHSGFSRRRPRGLRYSASLRRATATPGAPCPGSPSSAASPHVLLPQGAGSFACYPSGAPPGLPLGPGSPRADQLHPGNLGHPAWRIPTSISLLIPAFSLPPPPPGLAAGLPRRRDAPLPARPTARPTASASCFSPGHFRRAPPRPVSCYALFQRVAASEPTSWLSWGPHILSHLTRTLGPWPVVWALSLSAARLISCGLAPAHRRCGIRSLVSLGRL